MSTRSSRRKERRKLKMLLKQVRIKFPDVPMTPEQLIKDARHARAIRVRL